NSEPEENPIDIQDQDMKLVEDDNQSEIPVNTEKQDTILETSTKIVYESEYLKSNDIDKEIALAEEDIIEFNEEEIQNNIKDWEIKNFDEEELVLYKAIDSYSPKHYKIGVATKDGLGFIAVFNFDKEGREVAEYISDTPISIMNKNEQNKLNDGMIF